MESGPPAGTWREERVEDRETPHLFRDIVVTVTGAETGWRALAQAAEFAQREDSVLHGLHVITANNAQALAYGKRVLEEFSSRCQALGVRYTTSLAVGQVDEQIIQRARWADMVVINQRMVHGRWVQRPLGTIFQTVVAQAARPILAVPGTEVRPIQQILLAYDGSNQAREALFVFRHLVSCWHVPGTILTVEGGHCDRETLDLAWQYVQEAAEGTMVHTRYEQGEVADVILQAAEEEKADLLLMGSYGYQPLLKAVLGSTVDRVLRQAWFPVLICH